MNICVVVPKKDVYSETFIRAHVERLPGKVTLLYGGFFPKYLGDGSLLLPVPNFIEKLYRFFLMKIAGIPYKSFGEQALTDYLLRNKIDAVLAEYGPTGAAIANVCRKTKIPLIVHFHGFDAFEQDTLDEFGDKYKRMFELADAIIVVSRHMEKKIIELGAPAEKVHYKISNGMEPDKFYGADPAKAPPTFLSVGRFVDKKGPHLTLLAFQKMIVSVPEARLIMAGDGPLLDACMSLAKALKIEQAVNFVGVQSHEEIAGLMRRVRAFVQHSRTPLSGNSEGTPVAVVESGGAGLPVISTYHAGIPDVVENGVTGFLVREGDVDAMADRMIKLAQNPPLAARMGKAAREKVLTQFTSEVTIRKLADIIETAVKQKRNSLIC